MAEHHRKIELQSPDDLQYLISNVLRAATAKIDLDLPPSHSPSNPNNANAQEAEVEADPFRARVEVLVQEYIRDVFLTTGANITINGLDVPPSMIHSMLEGKGAGEKEIIREEFEPFEPKLWERAKELARQEEDLVEEIARLRRGVPKAVVEGVKGGFKDSVEGDEGLLRRKEEQDGEGRGELGVGELERQAEVEAGWRRGVEGLGRLRRGMSEMVAKADRAERAERYVVRGR